MGEGRYLEVNCMITAERDVPLTAHYKDIKYKTLRSGLDLVHLLKTVCILKYLQYNVYDHIHLITVSSPLEIVVTNDIHFF